MNANLEIVGSLVILPDVGAVAVTERCQPQGGVSGPFDRYADVPCGKPLDGSLYFI